VHPGAEQGRAHAFRDGDHGVDRTVVEEARVRSPGRHVVHAPRDDQPHARPAAERRQRVGARGVEVDHVVPGHEAAERQRRAHVQVVADAERHDAHAEPDRRPGERAVRVGRERAFVPAGAELAEERQHLHLAAAPPALGVDVQHAHLRPPGAA
jgi:hypothetical protein